MNDNREFILASTKNQTTSADSCVASGPFSDPSRWSACSCLIILSLAASLSLSLQLDALFSLGPSYSSMWFLSVSAASLFKRFTSSRFTPGDCKGLVICFEVVGTNSHLEYVGFTFHCCNKGRSLSFFQFHSFASLTCAVVGIHFWNPMSIFYFMIHQYPMKRKHVAPLGADGRWKPSQSWSKQRTRVSSHTKDVSLSTVFARHDVSYILLQFYLP